MILVDSNHVQDKVWIDPRVYVNRALAMPPHAQKLQKLLQNVRTYPIRVLRGFRQFNIVIYDLIGTLIRSQDIAFKFVCIAAQVHMTRFPVFNA